MQVHGRADALLTLVLGHGFGTDQSAWRFIMDSFTNRFKVITYDNVGAGKADVAAYSQSRYSKLESYADDIVDLCDEMNVRNAVFIGHSVSGMTGNAIKFSHADKAVIISIDRQDDFVLLAVKDEGQGIREEEMKRLFGKFGRLSARPTASTGLGLFIVKSLVEENGGTYLVRKCLGPWLYFFCKTARAN